MAGRPNILWIVTTQWRAQATGYAGDPNARTPWLDGLASEAVNYTQAVTPHPMGPQARAALLTGKLCPENGVSDYWDPLPSAARTVAHALRDRGYVTDIRDTSAAIAATAAAPHGFPAKLVVLLHDRWRTQRLAPLSIYPCELVSRNGDTLREIVVGLAQAWSLPAAYIDYLSTHCVWVNSLVDRIVSEPLRPAGAVAEPYALWAIERRPGLVLPCTHEAIVLTDDLESFERRKLFLLNLGHSFLADHWLLDRRADDETVLQAMRDPTLRSRLERVWTEEVLPVFDALNQGDEADAYLVAVRDRLLNPFLAHRLADIAKDHAQKKQRRFAPVIALAMELGLRIPQQRLRAALEREAAKERDAH